MTASELLTMGLIKGFLGETKFLSTERAGISLKVSHLEFEGDIYHDEWAADRSGGGQELVKVDTEIFTRVYAGGTIAIAALAALGISKAEVMTYLVQCLRNLGDSTRLHQDCGPQLDGDWAYSYRILEKISELPLTLGKEEIKYQGQVVFVHIFGLAPVE